jgi:hypothetical protein
MPFRALGRVSPPAIPAVSGGTEPITRTVVDVARLMTTMPATVNATPAG